jgi:hypothetical protein
MACKQKKRIAPLLRQCFFIQTCNIDNLNSVPPSGPQGSILIAINIPIYCRLTDSYDVNYYFVSSSQAPNPVGGVCQKIGERQYQCQFNDQSVFYLRFSNDQLNIGTCSVTTPSVCGNFCLINTKLYYSFYTLSPGAPTTCVAPTPPLTIAPPSACPTALQAQPTLPTGPPIAPVGPVGPDDSLHLKIQ